MMDEPLLAKSVSLPLRLEREVDELCDEFEEELKRGIVPDADAYLARLDPVAHQKLLHEMAQLVRGYAHGQSVGRPISDPDVTNTSPAPVGAAEEKAIGDTTNAYLRRSLGLLRQVDDAGRKFERALGCGERSRIDEIVASADAEVRPRLLRELLKLEMEYRARKGECPSLPDYCARFPDHARLVKYLFFENFVPSRVGEFAIQKLVGRGGFGHVYQGWDPKLSRNVAVKVFRRDPGESAHRNDGPLFEARSAAQLCHPGIVTIHAVLADEDGDEFLVMEYVDGRSLEDLLRSRRLPPHEAAELMLAVVQALQHSHERGLVHRDLKPANILLDQGNRPRVTDFGLALHLTDLRRSPDVAGTLPYMAPEQANGETHRLDARTDLWAVGVTLYRTLTGWLPFNGASRQELLDAIRHQEPKDPLQHDPAIPPELARIIGRCLAKRMRDRYQSASDLADDLRDFVMPDQHHGLGSVISGESAGQTAAVVPKGLRYFDRSDREFFLRLIPGARDRRGVPQGVRFWTQRLQERDADQTFRVGLLYGPSGCGKSSLVRAGVLPQLEHNVRAIVVEAARDDTELRLTKDLRRQFKDLTPGLTLPDMLAELREGSWLPRGDKLLLVLDQFEQWLHGWRQDEQAALIDALRQCDGSRIQALILVRDDFWMQATRLFRQLDIPLAEGVNASAVDLFDPAHAIAVLNDFGVAYGQLPPDSAKRSNEQTSFLERAVEELAVDGWIVPVRLCIFAEMVKSRPWTPATLRDLGGTEGLGTAFLEEVFDSRTASPMHRLYRKPVRAVLERLLPPPGSEIRGHLVPESELQTVSGYEHEPTEFMAIMRCLDQELRLVTPSDPDLAPSGDAPANTDQGSTRSYQLTHDFLVTAIRGWLNQTRRQTVRGRAELRLAEYTNAYAARPDARQLPSWWEWVDILVFTRQRRWKGPERSMMRAATSRYAVRGCVGLLAATLLTLGIYDRIAATRAEGVVQALTTSDSRDLPGVARLLTSQRRRVTPLLTVGLAAQQEKNEQYVRLLLGLAVVGDLRADELLGQLLDAEPSLALAISQVLAHAGQLARFKPRLWEVVRDATTAPDRRLRACTALAQLNPTDSADKWHAVADVLGEEMLRDGTTNPAHFGTWMDAFAPVRQWLVGPLYKSFGDVRNPDTERLLAATILARYAANDVSQLLELALESTPRQFEVFARILARHASDARPRIVREAQATVPPDATEDIKDRHARRQANAIMLLYGTGDDKFVWPALEHRPDPRLRSFLLHHFREVGAPGDWAKQFVRQKDPGIRQAMILALACTFELERPSETLSVFTDAVLRLYREDMDSGVHGAAEWALRKLGKDKSLEQAVAELAQLGMRPGFRWYVTPSRITMIIVMPPGEVVLGSPETEPGRDESDEGQWTCNLNWTFAISATEITQGQYANICPKYRHRLNEFAQSLDCPVNAVTWRDAQQFCRLLSEHDKVPDSEMTLPPVAESRQGPYQDCLKRIGYRLPIEAEWEVACRAGAATPRYFGYAPELLRYYAWCVENSEGHAWTVGRLWPNAFGLFDTLGNVSEWCQDLYAKNPAARPSVVPVAPAQLILGEFALRGNGYGSAGRTLRAANRRFALPTDTPTFARGFRIAHTIRPREATE